MQRFRLPILLTALVTLFGSAAVAEDHPKTVIGMLLPLTGTYAAVGADARQGIEAALKESGTTKLSFVYTDSKADPTTSVTEFRNLVGSERASGVFAFRGPVGMAVNPLSKSMKIPLLGGVGNKEFATSNPYAFQLWPRADDEGTFLARELRKRNLVKIALITVQDDWTAAVSQGFRDAWKAAKGELTTDAEIAPADTDLRTVLTQLRNAPPEAIVLNVGLPQIAPFLKQIKEQHLTMPIYSNFWASKKDVIDAAGEAVEGVRFVEMATDLTRLSESLKATYGASPSGATISAYVATLLLARAVESSSTPLTPEELHRSLSAITEVRSADSTFPIVGRCVGFPLALKVIERGKAVRARDE